MRGAAHAVHVVAEAECADTHAVVMAGSTRFFERSDCPVECRDYRAFFVRLSVCEHDDVDVGAGRVAQSRRKRKLVGGDQVGGAFGLESFDSSMRFKFACAAGEDDSHTASSWAELACGGHPRLLQLHFRPRAERQNSDGIFVAQHLDDDLGRVLDKVKAGEGHMALLRRIRRCSSCGAVHGARHVQHDNAVDGVATWLFNGLKRDAKFVGR